MIRYGSRPCIRRLTSQEYNLIFPLLQADLLVLLVRANLGRNFCAREQFVVCGDAK